MSKYRSSAVKKVRERSRQPHYLWRGIGCLMLLIIPMISIAAGYETINFALRNGYAVPYQLLGTPKYPEFFYASKGLMQILSPITHTRHFYAYAAASLLYMMVFGGLSSLVYAVVYRMVGPGRYGPLDAPPPNVKVKRYKR